VMRGCILLQAIPEAPHVFWNVSSVDYVAEAIVRIITRADSRQGREGTNGLSPLEAYNLNYPAGRVSMDCLRVWSEEAGYPMKEVSYRRWVALLDELPVTHPLRSLRDTFQQTSRFPHGDDPPSRHSHARLSSPLDPGDSRGRLGLHSPPSYQPRGLTRSLYHRLLHQLAEAGDIPSPSCPSSSSS